MSTHEWDQRVADSTRTRGERYINALEAQLLEARERIEVLEREAFVADMLIADIERERDAAINRCVARVLTEGTPGPGHGVTLHGYASELHEWLPGPTGEDYDGAGTA